MEPIPVEAQGGTNSSGGTSALAHRVRRWTIHMERAGGCVQDWDQEERSWTLWRQTALVHLPLPFPPQTPFSSTKHRYQCVYCKSAIVLC